MRAALDAHDLDAFVSHFREDYVGERPRHPGSPVSSRADVRNNWAEVISDVPDLRVDVPAAVEDGNTIWSEWRAYGTARSGAMLELRGVIILRDPGRPGGLVPHVSGARGAGSDARRPGRSNAE